MASQPAAAAARQFDPLEHETIRPRRLAADAAADARLFLRLSRPRERRHGRADHAECARVLRRRVRLWRRAVLPRLLSGRDPQQPDPQQRRARALDRPHPDHLGHHLRPDRASSGTSGASTASASCSASPKPGFYPGIVLYLTWWFPSYYRSRMMGIFQSASVISLIVGPPIVGAVCCACNGWLGLAGLAVAVHHRGAAADHHVLRDLVPADRPSEGRAVADAGTARPGCSSGSNSEQSQREAVRPLRARRGVAATPASGC